MTFPNAPLHRLLETLAFFDINFPWGGQIVNVGPYDVNLDKYVSAFDNDDVKLANFVC